MNNNINNKKLYNRLYNTEKIGGDDISTVSNDLKSEYVTSNTNDLFCSEDELDNLDNISNDKAERIIKKVVDEMTLNNKIPNGCVGLGYSLYNYKKDDINSIDKDKEGTYEYVDHPTHYNQYDTETIDMIERIWGKVLTYYWAEITAFKYRMRMGTKPGEDITKDLSKETWYLDRMQDIKNHITEEDKKFLVNLISKTF